MSYNIASVVLRAVFAIASSYCFHVGLTSPNPPPASEEQAKYAELGHDKSSAQAKTRDPFPIPVAKLVLVGKMVWHSITLAELAGIAVTDFGLLRHTRPLQPTQHPAELYISVESTIGLLLNISGLLLRLECFRRLRKNFTFELSVQKDHKLITDGPYAFVRHPAYTGSLLTLVGGLLVHLGRGSWCTERNCGVDAVASLGPVLGQLNWAGIAWGVTITWMSLKMFKRCAVEDEVLKAHFQDEWVRWAQKVPYKMVPYIY